jgi:AcrR family transcriptional regulator
MGRRSDHTREALHGMAIDAARKIVAKDGLRALSTRGIAKLIGYSAGTLYQLFADLDDLIVHLNATTLDGLFEACRDVDLSASAETALHELGNRYIRFVGDNPKLWNALFEHRLPDGKEPPEWYDMRVMRLLALPEKALAPLFPPTEHERLLYEAQVLWASLHGIVSLTSAQKLATDETPQAMVRSLATNYIAGLRHWQAIEAAEREIV